MDESTERLINIQDNSFIEGTDHNSDSNRVSNMYDKDAKFLYESTTTKSNGFDMSKFNSCRIPVSIHEKVQVQPKAVLTKRKMSGHSTRSNILA